jgi:hypothetical protein
MSAQSSKIAKRLRVVTTLEKKSKIIADFEDGRRVVSRPIGRELGIPPKIVRTSVADKKNI